MWRFISSAVILAIRVEERPCNEPNKIIVSLRITRKEDKNLDMKLEQALSSDLSAIQRLLDDCQLPYTDFNHAHLQHFLLMRDGNQLAGTAGLEAG